MIIVRNKEVMKEMEMRIDEGILALGSRPASGGARSGSAVSRGPHPAIQAKQQATEKKKEQCTNEQEA